MADEDRTFSPSDVEATRARMQGLGVGQKEMSQQRDPNREEHATDPGRTEGFDPNLQSGPPMEHTPQILAGGRVEPGGGDAETPRGDGLDDGAWLGEGTPANVDVHKLGERDTPENDWGEPADEGAVHGSNHTRRPDRTEAERGQGAKTRAHSKDIISRRV